jgi:hypothetical protein
VKIAKRVSIRDVETFVLGTIDEGGESSGRSAALDADVGVLLLRGHLRGEGLQRVRAFNANDAAIREGCRPRSARRLF